MVSPPVQLIETSRSIQTFNLTYDRLYREFQEKLVAEYAGMRSTYMGEYQHNFNQNSSRRDDRIAEMNGSIDTQESSIKDLHKVDELQESCLNRFFTMKQNLYYYRICMKAWLYYHKVQKRKNRLAAYTRNKIHRGKMRRLFESWRAVSH